VLPVLLLSALASLTVTSRELAVGSLPRGAQRVPVLALHMRADCSADAPIEEILLKRSGPGLSTDIAAVYAEMDGVRVSRVSVPDRRGEIPLRFQALTVPACKAIELSILADVASSAEVASEHRISLVDRDPIVSPGAFINITVLPSLQTKVRTAPYSVGSVSVDLLSALRRISYGADRVVARLRLTASGTEDQEVTHVVFTNQGSARNADLQNISLHDNRAQRVSSIAPRMTGDKVSLSLNPPVLISRGSSRIFELHADVRASRRRTIRFTVEEASDLRARDAS